MKTIRLDPEVLTALSSIDADPSRAVRKLLAESGISWAWWAAYRLSEGECWEIDWKLPGWPHPAFCDACASVANGVLKRNFHR